MKYRKPYKIRKKLTGKNTQSYWPR